MVRLEVARVFRVSQHNCTHLFIACKSLITSVRSKPETLNFKTKVSRPSGALKRSLHDPEHPQLQDSVFFLEAHFLPSTISIQFAVSLKTVVKWEILQSLGLGQPTVNCMNSYVTTSDIHMGTLRDTKNHVLQADIQKK